MQKLTKRGKRRIRQNFKILHYADDMNNDTFISHFYLHQLLKSREPLNIVGIEPTSQTAVFVKISIIKEKKHRIDTF